MIKLTLSVHTWSPPSDKEQKPVTYKVHKVVGSTKYWPGRTLLREEVRDLCRATGMFQITIEEDKNAV